MLDAIAALEPPHIESCELTTMLRADIGYLSQLFALLDELDQCDCAAAE